MVTNGKTNRLMQPTCLHQPCIGRRLLITGMMLARRKYSGVCNGRERERELVRSYKSYELTKRITMYLYRSCMLWNAFTVSHQTWKLDRSVRFVLSPTISISLGTSTN